MTESALNAKVQALLEKQIAEGRALGTQAAAYRYGELIADACAGSMGPKDPRPVRPDSLFNSFSTTKGVAALAVHMAADRGQLEYDAPVAKYWPGFAKNGKENITVAQAMSHQSGLHAAPPPPNKAVCIDWDAAASYIENLAPAWEPGTATGYHAITYAWIAGGIVQGATGKHIRDFIREEIAEPLGIGDTMYVGIPDGVEERLTTLEQRPPIPEGGAQAPAAANPFAQLPPDHDFFKAMPPVNDLNFNDMDVRRACIPSANGHFSARALAKMYGALANGGEIEGVRLVSKERISEIQRVVTEQPDRVIIMAVPKGIGFWMGGNWAGGVPSFAGPRRTAFGHPGAGGSAAWADPDVGLSVAVTLNKMQQGVMGGGITGEIGNLIREELGVNS